jgi:hypothetical protein
MDVDLVQEIEIPSNTVTDTWQVNPRSCLILWGYIAYIQRVSGANWRGAARLLIRHTSIKIHRTLRMSPAMAAGVTDRLWSVEDLVALWEAYEQRRAERAA